MTRLQSAPCQGSSALLTLIPGTSPSPVAPPRQHPRARGGDGVLWHCTDFELVPVLVLTAARTHRRGSGMPKKSSAPFSTRARSLAWTTAGRIAATSRRRSSAHPMLLVPSRMPRCVCIAPRRYCIARIAQKRCLVGSNHRLVLTLISQLAWRSAPAHVRARLQESLSLLPGQQLLPRYSEGAATAAAAAVASAARAGRGCGGERIG